MEKHNELKLQEQGQSSESINMLGTIKLPSNLKLIQSNLPGSNYDSDKESKRPKKKHDLDEIKEVPEQEQIP